MTRLVAVASGATGSDGTVQVAWNPTTEADYSVAVVNIGSLDPGRRPLLVAGVHF